MKLRVFNEAMEQHKNPMPKPFSRKGHALSTRALYASSDRWTFDFSASHHMTHSHKGGHIVVGDST